MKSVPLVFRVTEEEYDLIREAAESQAMPVSTFIRWLLLREDAKLLRYFVPQDKD